MNLMDTHQRPFPLNKPLPANAKRNDFVAGDAKAFDVVAAGLGWFPYDVDLLADTVRWAPLEPNDADSSQPADGEDRTSSRYACDYYYRLKELGSPKSWRAYDFSIDYLIDRKLPVKDRSKVQPTLDEALNLAEEFIMELPLDERAYSAMVKVLRAMHRDDEAEAVLRGIIFGEGWDGPPIPVAQCSITYADILLARGDYEEAIRAAKAGLKGTAVPQPSANALYLLLTITMARDALLLSDTRGDDILGIDAEEANSIMTSYTLLYQAMNEETYRATIRDCVCVLGALLGKGDVLERLKEK